MADTRQQQARQKAAQAHKRNRYLDGNAVRKEAQSYEYVRVETERERKKYHVRKNWKKASFMTLPYVMALFLASIVVLMVSVRYLEARNNINDGARTIITLERQLENLREANSGLKKNIENYTDLSYIYRIATEEMGMLPAREDQIIRFDRTESGYVRQNEDIPTE